MILDGIFSSFSKKACSVQVFKRFHAAYVDAVSNPFYNVGALITSAKFALAVKTVVDSADFF